MQPSPERRAASHLNGCAPLRPSRPKKNVGRMKIRAGPSRLSVASHAHGFIDPSPPLPCESRRALGPVGARVAVRAALRSVEQPEAATALSVSTHGSALSLGEAWAATVDQKERIRSMVDEYSEFVARTLLTAGVPQSDVDDEVQRTFMVAARRLDAVRLGSERAFLYRVARHTAAHAQRTRGRCREIPSGDLPDVPNGSDAFASPESLAQRRQMWTLVAGALDRMRESLRAVFVLYDLEGTVPKRDRGALEPSGGHRGFTPSAGAEGDQDAARTRIRAGTRGWEQATSRTSEKPSRASARAASAEVAIWERCSTAATPSRSICSAPSPHRPPRHCRSADLSNRRPNRPRRSPYRS